MKARYALLTALLLSLSGHVSAQGDQDPPSRVARLNYLHGNVSMEPAGVDEWAAADLNRPFTVGDYLYADQGGEAELHLDVAAIRIGAQTSFGFLNLDDRTVQLKLTEGDMSVRVHNFGSDQVFEVDTPNAAVTLLRDGTYRFRIDPSGNMSFVVVREGQAEITGGGQAFTLNPENSATLNGTDQLSFEIGVAPQPDEFDRWCEQRDAHEGQRASARYLPPTVIGSEDLDDYGVWQETGDYGAVWYPRNVDPGWAPYHSGHWAWIEPWGWTWIDSMPWGFAPFHYGRWAYVRDRWGWCPGPITVGYRGPVVRPYYAPAMVAWFGGAHWGAGISLGGGPSLGWVPLGWGEVYTPAYHCSPRYFDNVNRYNTRVVNNVNITNVYNTVYVNKQVYNQQFVNVRAPNAVMAMPGEAFASGRPVRQAGVAVRQADFARMQGAGVNAPPATPTRQSVLGAGGLRPAARPSSQVMGRQVVARSTPPPVRASFAARQPYLAQHAGQPVDQQAMRQAAQGRPVEPNVRQAVAVNPISVRPGQRGGDVGANARPVSPNQPTLSTPPRVGVSGPVEGPPPNRQLTPVRPGTPPAPMRPGSAPPNQQPTPVRPGPPLIQARPAAPQPNQQPAPAVHGLPPNLRPGNGQNDRNGRITERTAPNAPRPRPEPQERSQPAPNAPRPRPEIQERSQPAPNAPRPQPEIQERSQPAPNAPRPRPEPQERSQPATERRNYPEKSSEPQERSQPRGESKPAHEERPAPSHDSHSNNDKKPN